MAWIQDPNDHTETCHPYVFNVSMFFLSGIPVPMSPSSDKTHSQPFLPFRLICCFSSHIWICLFFFKCMQIMSILFGVHENRLPRVNCSLTLLNLDLINRLWSTWFSESFASLTAKCHWYFSATSRLPSYIHTKIYPYTVIVCTTCHFIWTTSWLSFMLF